MIAATRRRPASAIGAWLLSVLTNDLDEGRRHLAVIAARIDARQFRLAEFIVVRVVFEELVHKYLPADSEARAVNAVAHEAVRMVEPDATALFGWPAPDLLATAAVIHRAMGDEHRPRYLGFADDIGSLWTSVGLALVKRHRPRAGEIRKLVLKAEHTAAGWDPPVVLTPAASVSGSPNAR
ncbi:MAG: hypothetical protein HOV83_06885 [Catenulispora sp.]|nr:hypothetical protein [Catenulispora sp.]